MKNEDMNPNKGQDSSPTDSNEEELIASIGKHMVIDHKQLILGTMIAETDLSTIYQALYKNESVAVKIIKESDEALPNVHFHKNEKFLREVRMHYLAQHETVVTFIAASTKPKMQIVMELMRGGSLSKYCSDRQPGGLDMRVAIGFAIQISQAMEHLHGQGIVHRDLKLGNLLLTENAEKVKLADFGLSRTVADDKVMTPNAGTYIYMAPEIWGTSEEPRLAEKISYDHKVDVFSFSIVLIKLVKSLNPFQNYGLNLRAKAFEIYKNKLRPSVENIPARLVLLLDSGWAEEASSRPEFSEITTGLLEFLNTLPLAEAD